MGSASQDKTNREHAEAVKDLRTTIALQDETDKEQAAQIEVLNETVAKTTASLVVSQPASCMALSVHVA